MSNFVVSARKYRPALFEEVVGQEHVSKTLKNALKSDHLAHAFLFCGPRGVGKTTCARILAKILNCQNRTSDFEACGTCQSCRAFQDNASFNIYELDAASNNSVEDIRALVEQVRFPPQNGKYKIYIIDEVHMLSQGAFNAFLKTLEEPPPYAIFILATTEKHKILPTILSRCQIFDFRRIQIIDIVRHLQQICVKEGIEADEDALHIIAQKADGGLRDALSIFDRIVSFTSGRKMTYEDVISNLNVLDYDYYFRIIDALLTENMSQTVLIFDDILRKGFEADLFVGGLAEHIRNILMCKDEQTLRLMEVSDALMERYRQQAALAPMAFLLTTLNLANDCDVNYKSARNKNLHVEMTLIKMAFTQRAVALASGPPLAILGENLGEKKTAELTSEIVQNTDNQIFIEKEAVITAVEEKKILPIAPAPKSTPSLDDLYDQVEKEQEAEKQYKEPPTEEAMREAWSEYVGSLNSPMIKSSFSRMVLNYLVGSNITVSVSSASVAGTMNDEKSTFLSFIEQRFGQAIQMEIIVNPELFPDEPKSQKPLNPIEKKKIMLETYPILSELETRFSLKSEG